MLEHKVNRQQRKDPEDIRPPDQSSEHQSGEPHVDLAHSRAPAVSRWLTVDEVRKLQRMRRETVLEAIARGELPAEQRGRIRYIRVTDMQAWEERRLKQDAKPSRGLIHSDLTGLL